MKKDFVFLIKYFYVYIVYYIMYTNFKKKYIENLQLNSLHIHITQMISEHVKSVFTKNKKLKFIQNLLKFL